MTINRLATRVNTLILYGKGSCSYDPALSVVSMSSGHTDGTDAANATGEATPTGVDICQTTNCLYLSFIDL